MEGNISEVSDQSFGGDGEVLGEMFRNFLMPLSHGRALGERYMYFLSTMLPVSTSCFICLPSTVTMLLIACKLSVLGASLNTCSTWSDIEKPSLVP